MGSLGGILLNVTKNQLFRGSILSSIAHAIMTNTYPELSYEQSWDGCNFSMNDGNGIRGTITFLENQCIGAIRNESGNIVYGHEAILSLIKSFPLELSCIAQTDTLQYLLDHYGDEVVPGITSIFWCDCCKLYWISDNISSFKRDFELFQICALPQRDAITVLQAYYGMNADSLELLHELFEKKSSCFSERVVLSELQKLKIPGKVINDECSESFREMNIVC